jgi:exopolysaccharide biosynthesis polyprenyl glycosylphosphotransferase
MEQRSQVRYAPDIFEVENIANLIPLLNEKIASPPPKVWLKGLIGLFAKPFPLALALCTLDVLAASLGLWFALVLKSSVIGPEASDSYIAPIISYVIYLIAILYLKSGYHLFKDKRPEHELQTLITSNIYAFSLTLATNFIFSKGTVYSRYVFLLGFLLTTGFLLAIRFNLKNILRLLWSWGYAKQNVIIVGNSLKNIKWFLDHINVQRYLGFNILGYLASQPLDKPISGLSYLGIFEQLPGIAQHFPVDKIFFAMHSSSQRHQALKARLEDCSRLNIPALIISEIFNDFHFSLTLDGYTGIFQVTRPNPGYDNLLYKYLKRLSDIPASLILFLVSLPIWAVAVVAIKWQDRGPIFFKHRLVGKDGELFDMIKFRTMIVNAQEVLENDPNLLEKFKVNYKLDDDPRITPFGKWLRKTSLDELPQLINILKGDMSLVGPRPVRPDELEKFGDFKYERIKVRHGLTGFWQVSGRCDTDYAERVQMDRFYLNKCSIWLDLLILLKTSLKVLKSDGAM